MAMHDPFPEMSTVLCPQYTGTDPYSKGRKLWPKGACNYLMGSRKLDVLTPALPCLLDQAAF